MNVFVRALPLLRKILDIGVTKPGISRDPLSPNKDKMIVS